MHRRDRQQLKNFLPTEQACSCEHQSHHESGQTRKQEDIFQGFGHGGPHCSGTTAKGIAAPWPKVGNVSTVLGKRIVGTDSSVNILVIAKPAEKWEP
jgi:hypothetical protein